MLLSRADAFTFLPVVIVNPVNTKFGVIAIRVNLDVVC